MTGNTKKLADRIAEKFQKSGQTVSVTLLQTDVPVTSGAQRSHVKFNITNLPDISASDAVAFGCPVWAFCATPVIMSCIKSLGTLHGKKVIPFATMFFPLKFMGGYTALTQMQRISSDLKATTLPGVVVNRFLHNFEESLNHAADTVVSRLI